MQSIVIVGGGAGGLEAATRLGNKLGKKGKAKITLVDRTRSHIWKPLLHEVASGSLDPSIDGVIYHAHGVQHGYNFIHGEVTQLALKEQRLTVQNTRRGECIEQEITFDQLILAVGSVSNDFKTTGVAEHCRFLDRVEQANVFHHELIDRLTDLNQSDAGKSLKVAIVGAGATGVELSAELHHSATLLKGYGFGNVGSQQLSITLIEAGERILPVLGEDIANAARRELNKLGVQVKEGVRVTAATAEGFLTADGSIIESDMLVWAAGIKGPDWLREVADISLTRSQQIEVDHYLRAKDFDNVYVLGDCAAFVMDNGKLVPPRAQSAHQMAKNVADNIIANLNGAALTSFKYVDYGSLVNLARFTTVGNLMGNLGSGRFFVHGLFARIMYLSLYRMHQTAIHGIPRTMLLWVVHKLNRFAQPKLKLH